METITLPRTGDRSLQFVGEEVASVSSRMVTGNQANRWHELSLYRTDSGKLVLAVGYRTQWQGELDHDVALVCTDTDAVVEEIRMVNPIENLVGFPPGEQYAEKQARIERDIVARFEAAVSEILQHLEPERI